MTLASVMGVGAVGTAIVPDGLRIERDPIVGATGSEAHDEHAAQTTSQTTTDKKTLSVDEMDAMHEKGIKSFPAVTKGLGGQQLDFEMDGDVKVFRLTCQLTEWEFDVGQTVEAWTYNGVVPGPEIRVTEGDRVRVLVENQLPESTAVHWHGLTVPNDQDGVPFLTQPPIKPGQTHVYEFQIRDGNVGSHMYHSHMNAAKQVQLGMLGPFIVEPRDPSTRPAFDREYTMVLNEGPIAGYSINGKGFPATQPLTAQKGERVLVRFMNEGVMIHPMHLHGMPMQVVASDGWLLQQPYLCDTINVAPGQRVDVIIDATELGAWAFHCHILTHAETDHGMFGMVSALIVEE